MHTLKDRFGVFSRLVNSYASSPNATASAFVFVVLWAASGPYFRYSEFWQLAMNTASAVVTFLMVFVLNNAQSRDTKAINAKLDSLIFALENADNRLIGLEEHTDSTAQSVLKDVQAAVEEAKSSFESADQ